MKRLRRITRTLVATTAVTYLGLIAVLAIGQRKLLYFPSNEPAPTAASADGLVPWIEDGRQLGMTRYPASPRRVWLFAHGNGGQASHRGYALPYFNADDAVFIVEYPGFGTRPGSPSETVLNDAVHEAYTKLCARFGAANIAVLGESLGSGPASRLARHATPPRRIVLVVPFDDIVTVAQEKFPWFPIRGLMRDRWNNIDSLSDYKGRLDIWGATDDTVIPVHHAKNLARKLPRAVFHEFPGGHGWADTGRVTLAECPTPGSRLSAAALAEKESE